MKKSRSTQFRRFLTVVSTTLALAAGLTLAAQESGRADRFTDPTDRERMPLWTPGSDVPMVTYLDSANDLLAAPPR